MTLVKHCDGGCDPDGLYRITHYAHNHRRLPPPRSSDARGAERIGAERIKADQSGPHESRSSSRRSVPLSAGRRTRARARARLRIYIRRRKKRQKNSETDTSRDWSVAERNGSLLLCLFAFFLSPSPSLLPNQVSVGPISQSVSQSVSLFSFSSRHTHSLSLSVCLSSNHLPAVFPRASRATDTTDENEEDHARRVSTLPEGGFFFFFFFFPRADRDPTLARARPEERNCPDRITPRLPSSTYAGSLEYENILRSLSLPPLPPSRPSPSPSTYYTNPTRFSARSFARSLARSLCTSVLPRARARAHPRAAHQQLGPPLIDSCAISRHSCQINNARRPRRRLPRNAAGVEAASRCEIPWLG